MIQATTWVRKESEKVVSTPALYAKVPVLPFPDVRACFVQDAHSARYETHCSEAQQAQAGVEAPLAVTEAGSEENKVLAQVEGSAVADSADVRMNVIEEVSSEDEGVRSSAQEL